MHGVTALVRVSQVWITARVRDGMARYIKRPILREFFWYLVFAAINFAINLGLTMMLHEWLLMPAPLAVACSITLAFFVSFLSFRYVVLESAKEFSALRQLRSFLLTSVCFRLAEYASFLVLFALIGLNYLVAILIVLSVSFCSKFFFYRLHVFGPNRMMRPKARL